MCVEELGSQTRSGCCVPELAPEELLNESCVDGGPGLLVHSLVAPQASRVLVGAQTHGEGKQQASPVSC